MTTHRKNRMLVIHIEKDEKTDTAEKIRRRVENFLLDNKLLNGLLDIVDKLLNIAKQLLKTKN